MKSFLIKLLGGYTKKEIEVLVDGKNNILKLEVNGALLKHSYFFKILQEFLNIEDFGYIKDDVIIMEKTQNILKELEIILNFYMTGINNKYTIEVKKEKEIKLVKYQKRRQKKKKMNNFLIKLLGGYTKKEIEVLIPVLIPSDYEYNILKLEVNGFLSNHLDFFKILQEFLNIEDFGYIKDDVIIMEKTQNILKELEIILNFYMTGINNKYTIEVKKESTIIFSPMASGKTNEKQTPNF